MRQRGQERRAERDAASVVKQCKKNKEEERIMAQKNAVQEEPMQEGSWEAAEEKHTAVAKCRACGADMIYDAESGELLCEHCGSRVAISAKTSEEQAFERLMQEGGGWEDSHVFRCENCGAQEILDKLEIAKQCPFCGATNIVETEELPKMRPNAIVPFRVGQKQAGAQVKTWVRKRLFAPQKFRKSAKPEKMKGVYMPAFSFDSATTSYYSGVLGKYYYVTKRVNGRTVQERRIRYYNVSGSYERFFDDVLIQASGTISQQSLNKLQPFQTNDSREYTKEYLSGYTATQNTKDGLACWEEAKTTIDSRIRSEILSKYNCDTVSYLNVSTQYLNITYKYILLPVYVGHCKWRQKLYNFFVNGLSGKVTGKAPISPVKVAVTVVVGIGVLIGLYFLWRTFGG